LLMAWPPPADKRRIAWVSAPGDYATFNSNHTPDGTDFTPGERLILSPATIPLRYAAEKEVRRP
jgi:hypothetical protein